MEIFVYLVFALIAIIIKEATAEEEREKTGGKAEKFDVEGLLTSAKEAFQDRDEPTPPAKTPEELMNENSWDKLTSAMEAFQDLDDPISPADAVSRLFDLDGDSDADDDGEDEFELAVDGRTLKFEVPSADDRDGKGHYFSADETGEGHVASVGLSREKQLEQLKTWREAGLIDEDEYKERKRKIKRG